MKVASGTSVPAAIRAASGITRCIKPAPAALAPSPQIEGAWINRPEPPTIVTVPTEYLLEFDGRFGNVFKIKFGTFIRFGSISYLI